MTESRQVNHPGRNWLLAGLIVIGIVVALNESFIAMFRLWISFDQYNHCLLIAPVSAWLIWRQRHDLEMIPPAISWWAVTAFVLVAGLWVLGTIGRVAIIQHFAAVSLIPLTFWALLGTTTARALAFPLGYLLFLIPFGSSLIPALMTYTADMTVGILKLTGMPIYHDGLYIAIPNGSFRIVESCSGIRMLMAGVAIGSLYAYLNFNSWWRRVFFVGFVILLTLAANWFRAIAIVVAAHWSGMAVIADHIWVGYVLFALVIIIMLWVGAKFAQHDVDNASTIVVPAPGDGTPAGATLSVATLLLMVTLATPVLTGAAIDSASQSGNAELAPLPVADGQGGWSGPEATGMREWLPSFRGDFEERAANYRHPAGVVELVRLDYRSSSADSEMINETNRLFDASRWILIDQVPRSVVMANGDSLEYLATILEDFGGRPRLIRHWYIVDGEPRLNRFGIKASELLSMLTGRPASEAVLMISSRVPGEMATTEALLDEFMAEVLR